MNNKNFLKSKKAGLALCAALLGTLGGCVGYVDGPRAGYYGPRTGYYSQPGVVIAQDDYVYYPQYEFYYSVSRHEYAYREGNAWVSRRAPRGVSEYELRVSPSVRMNFHDSPARHHSEVVQQYPRNWKPSGEKQGWNRNDDSRDDNRGR